MNPGHLRRVFSRMELGLTETDVWALLDRDSAAAVRGFAFDLSWDGVGERLAAIRAGHPAAARPALWRRLVREFRDFLCTDSSTYADLRRQWDALREQSAAVAVTALTAALASELGVASTVAAPLVIWLVLVAIRMGRGAICDGQREKTRRDR